jgi:predicted nucleic acid-binding protein
MAKLDQILTSKVRIGMDTSPFIYYFEHHTTYFPLVHEIVDYVENRPLAKMVTSTLTLLETIVFPLRNNRTDLVAQYRTVLTETDYLQLIELGIPVMMIAAELRAKYNFRTPDAIQIGSCIHSNADLFVTNDKSFRRVQEIEILVLDDFV